MRRGFITIATGSAHYQYIAANLLTSYRCHTNVSYPFAIIVSEENEYTSLFDDVIVTEEYECSFMDKFLLLKLCPYDETIFIDADSLAYGDLNVLWDFFRDATDFSALGANVGLDSEEAWYDISGIGEYGSRISYKVRVHSGICFIRKSSRLLPLYDDCRELNRNYNKLQIRQFSSSREEAILGIAMPMNNMRATVQPPDMLAVLPNLTSVSADIRKGLLRYRTPWGDDRLEKGLLIHFGTSNTYEPLYLRESARLLLLMNGTAGSFTERFHAGMVCYYLRVFVSGCVDMLNRLKRLLHRFVQ